MGRVLDDRHDPLELVRVELARAARRVSENGKWSKKRDAPLVQVDIRLLADDVGVPPADTLDLREGVHDFALAVDIGVQKTQDVLRTE